MHPQPHRTNTHQGIKHSACVDRSQNAASCLYLPEELTCGAATRAPAPTPSCTYLKSWDLRPVLRSAGTGRCTP